MHLVPNGSGADVVPSKNEDALSKLESIAPKSAPQMDDSNNNNNNNNMDSNKIQSGTQPSHPIGSTAADPLQESMPGQAIATTGVQGSADAGKAQVNVEADAMRTSTSTNAEEDACSGPPESGCPGL